MGLYQTKKLLHSKGNHQQNEKATLWNRRKYFQIIFLLRGEYSKYIKNSYNSVIVNLPIQLKMGRGAAQTFSQRSHTNGKKVMKRYSTSLIREITMRYPLLGSFVHCWWECKLMQPLWKTVWGFFKTLIELPYDEAFLLLGTYPKQTKTPPQKDICTLLFTAALCTIAKSCKQPPISGWMDEMWTRAVAHYLTLKKKKEILPFVRTRMNFKGIMLSEIIQTEVVNYHMILYVESKKEKAKNKQKDWAHGHREQSSVCLRWEVGKMGEESKGTNF